MARVKKKRKLTFISKFLLLIFFLVGVCFCYQNYDTYKLTQKKVAEELLLKEKKEKEKQYNNCLNKKHEETSVTEELLTFQTELTNMLKQYKVSVYYEDIKSGYNYKYNEDQVIYGASLIKLVDALYLFDNSVDLNKTVLYESKYIRGSSKGMDKRNVGENISLNDLINYSLSVSDNTAHIMLVDYIGYDTLRDYGKSLGASAILTNVGGEKYGNQTAYDTNIYLKKAYEIMTNIKDYPNGYLLKDYMTNDYKNYLIIENETNIAHKYGSFNDYFHNIGVVFNENPYTISILTQHGNSNYKEIINEIHTKINEMHIKYRGYIEQTCYELVY